MLFPDNFPKASTEPRGCGERVPGGAYAESGGSSSGLPIESFMFDPPRPLPPGLDLVNKTIIWQRPGTNGQPELDENGQPIFDLLIHIGAAHYPYVPDFVEEARRLGVSRRINSNADLSLLSIHSQIWLAHPKAIPLNWQDLTPPELCEKHLLRHDLVSYRELELDPAHDEARPGPCIFKLWQLIPEEEGDCIPMDTSNEQSTEGEPLHLRTIGSTVYPFNPSGESADGWAEGFILCLPLTGIALVRRDDGSVNERAKEKVLAGVEKHGQQALPFYETDR